MNLEFYSKKQQDGIFMSSFKLETQKLLVE